MTRLSPLLFGVAIATALSLSPVDFGPLPIPAGVQSAEAASSVGIDVFFSPLASHGVWVKHPKYRYVFCPKVDAKWRPYSHGHWLYMKNYGWYFSSDEPFAWAVYHYGRWFHEQKLGWCWVPGNAWAGAWVAWRRGNDYVGWAPLEPTRDGFAVDVDISNQEPPQPNWIFVPPKRFLEPRLEVTVVFGDQQPDAFQKTQFAGPVVVQNNIVVNNNIDINFIQQQTNTKVVVVDPKAVDKPDQAAADANGNTVAVFAPQIAQPTQKEAPQQAVDENQAAQQLGNRGDASSAASSAPSSASSDQPSSAASSSAPEPSVASSAPTSSASEPASQASSAPASSAAAPSAPAPSSDASSAAVSSAAEPSASSPPTSKLSSSSEAAPAPAAPKASSSEAPAPSKAPAPSSEAASAAPESSAAEPSSEAASSAAPPEPAASSQECPEGYQIVKGKCVPLESSAAKK